MSSVFLLALQMGIVISGFVGMGKVVNWYHKEGEDKERGGASIDKNRNIR